MSHIDPFSVIKALAPKVMDDLVGVMQKQTVTTVAAPDAAKAAAEVAVAVKQAPGIAIVPVKSAATSVTNWAQIIGVAAMAGSYFGLNVSPQEQSAILLTIGVVTKIFTLVWKTWFSNSVTAAAAGKTA